MNSAAPITCPSTGYVSEPECGDCGGRIGSCDCEDLASLRAWARECVECDGVEAAHRLTDADVLERLVEWADDNGVEVRADYAARLQVWIKTEAEALERRADQAERDECCGDVCSACADRDADGFLTI